MLGMQGLWKINYRMRCKMADIVTYRRCEPKSMEITLVELGKGYVG
jgi:hypothetical protein